MVLFSCRICDSKYSARFFNCSKLKRHTVLPFEFLPLFGFGISPLSTNRLSAVGYSVG
nr:MAG TPA: C2H2 type zinc-finger protein [Caudoviricetes sp.]